MPSHYIVPEYPFVLNQQVTRERAYRDWANKNAEHTPIEFAKWLIKLVEINNEV